MLTQVGEKADALSYVLVEMVNKDKVAKKQVKYAKDMERGLFSGIMVYLFDDNSTKVYIVLDTAGDEITLLDLDYYNILSIELFDGIVREYLFVRDTDEDQEKAFVELTDLVTGLATAKRTLPGLDLVDVSTYTDLPSNFTDPIDTKTTDKTTSFGSNVGNKTNKTTQTTKYPLANGNTTYNNQANVRKATFFKRVSDNPQLVLLNAMAKNLKEIQEEMYDAPEFPATDDAAEVYCAGNNSSYYNQSSDYWG